MESFDTIWAVASFMLLHTALVAYYAGKITSALDDLKRRAEHWDNMIDEGTFPHCLVHKQRMNSIEQRLDKIEQKAYK
jgi:hypothetical protein